MGRWRYKKYSDRHGLVSPCNETSKQQGPGVKGTGKTSGKNEVRSSGGQKFHTGVLWGVGETCNRFNRWWTRRPVAQSMKDEGNRQTHTHTSVLKAS